MLVRLAKLLAVAALFGGAVATVLPSAQEDRRRAAYLVYGPAFGAVWVFGFLLVALSERSFFEPFILAGMGLSLVSLQGVLYIAGRPGRRTLLASTVALLPLVIALVWMVLRFPL